MAGLLGMTLLARAVSFPPAVINPDESIFALAAREVLNGNLPYERFFDNKPVASTFLIAAAFRLLGQSIHAVRLLGVLCVWASAALTYALMSRGGASRSQSLCAALLYIAFTTTMGGFATLTEILLAPFTILAVLLMRETLDRPEASDVALFAYAGLASGLAILIKIVPLIPGYAVAGAVLALLVGRNRVSIARAAVMAVCFAIGSAVPMLISALVYVQKGLLADFMYATFGFAKYYAASNPGLGTVATRLGTVVDSLWPLLALAAAGIVVLANASRLRQKLEPLPALAVIWLLAELLAAGVSRHFYPHYFLSIVPPLVVLASLAIRSIAVWIGGVHARRAELVLSLIAIVIPLERAEVDAVRDLIAKPDVARALAVAILRASAGRTPTLFVTNYQLSVLYSLVDAPLPPTRFAVPAHLFSRQSAMIRVDPAAEVARVLAAHPQFVVTDAEDRLPGWAQQQLGSTLARGYRPIYTAGTVSLFQAVHGSS